MQNATALVQTDPLMQRVIDRARLRTDEQRERVLMTAVTAVYSNFCSNSVAELEEAVVKFMGIPLERDDD